jgi:hypothetical protein
MWAYGNEVKQQDHATNEPRTKTDAPAWTLEAYREHITSVLSDMRDFMQRLVDERDKQYDARFRAAEVAMAAAFAAQKESMANAFLASDKAIVKSEEAQRAYNERSNEFRGQLDDQAKMLMPRSEVTAMMHSLEDKFYATTQAGDRERATLTDRLSSLEQGSANLQGRIWAITALAWVIALAVSIALRFIR